ncbi:MAG: hypothetical protein C0392_15005 [Syntrophus sp. (in: bacteria)]|nr:hypothetical protein [Syntrophus sp. (in: bacteria)]
MQIKTRLKTVSWIAAIMAILVISLYAWTSEQLKQAAAQRNLSEEMATTHNNRMVLRDEYMLNHNERPKEQWLQQTENLKKLVERAQAAVVLPEQKLILQQIPLYLDKTKVLFTRLVVNQDDMVAGRISVAQSQEMERLVYSQLIIDAHSLLTKLLKLQRISDREYAIRQSQSNVLILASVLLLVCFTIFSSMLLARSIAKPLKRLRDGIEVISTGNLDHQVGTESKDEIGQLSRAFDGMIANLKQITVSRDNLEAEITERKRAEEALRDAELIFRTIFDKASDGILLAENESRTFYMANNKICEMLGYTQKEIIKIGLSEIHLEKDLPYVIEQFERIRRNEISVVSDIPFMRKDGRIFYADINSSLINLGGKDYLLGVFRDITERKRAKEVLRESEEKFSDVVESIPVAIYLSVGIEQKCEYLNPMFTKLFGYTLDMVPTVDKWWPLAYPDENYRRQISEEWTAKVKRAIETQSPIEPMEVVVTCKDGSKKNILWRYITMGNKNYACGLDLTKRKQAEEEIKKLNAELEQRVIDRTVQLEASNKELASFAYSVSHDLRAPLRGIDGWSLALLEDYGEKLDDQAHKYLHRVRTETQQMGRLIDDMLKLSRVTRAELQLMPIDLTAMARSIAARLQEEMQHRRIEFIIQPALRANGDTQLIDIALFNLFDNAVKFTGTRSHARIEFGESEVEGEKTFFIQDDGVGFDMAYAPNLFGAFQRLHKSSEFPGTGVGLATVQRIIHRHGGRIWANAQVDQGATFYFTLKETT